MRKDAPSKNDEQFDLARPVMTRYDSDGWHPTIINPISGTSDHTIHKVMHAVAQVYAQDELLEMLSTYERIYLIDIAHHIPVDELRRKHIGNLSMIKSVDALTEQRYNQVIELYRHEES